MKIKSFVYPLIVLLMSVGCLSSCMLSQDEKELSENCYISSFTLGSLKRTLYTTSSEGEDSLYTVSFSGSLFPMSVDQLTLTIENRDSLPYGTKVNAVLASVNFEGVLVYRTEGEENEKWIEYNKSDSIDFSQPLNFTVYSESGNSSRHYVVKVNVHQQNGSDFSWTQEADCADLEALQQRRLVALDDQLVMLGTKADGTVMCATRSNTPSAAWKVQNATGAEGANIQTVQVMGNQLLMSTLSGALLESTDGVNWSLLAEGKEGLVLAGISVNRIYALTNGAIESSIDGGATWDVESLDDSADYLPTDQISMIRCTQDNNYDRMVLVGTSDSNADKKASVWSKAWRTSNGELEAEWMYYPHTADNKYVCPQMDPLFVLPYDEGLIALGGKSQDGKHEVLDTILYSRDYGLTWKPTDELCTPAQLQGTSKPMAITVDKDNFLWIVAGKETWRGRLNRLGFSKQ